MSVDVPPAALLAGFRSWLAVERGLSRETVRCYNNQAGTFLASLPEPVESAVRQLDSGQVTSFMVGYCRDRNVESAKAMATSLRALLRLAGAAHLELPDRPLPVHNRALVRPARGLLSPPSPRRRPPVRAC